MRKFLNILKKETRELFIKQIVIPLLLTMFIFSLLGEITKSEIEKVKIPADIGILDLDNSNYSNMIQGVIRSANFNVHVLNKEEKERLVEVAIAKGLKMVILIPEGFERDIISKKGTEIEFYSIIRSVGMKERLEKALFKKILNNK